MAIDQPTGPASARNHAFRAMGALGRTILYVEVVEAAGLLATEKGGAPNPKAQILLIDPSGKPIRSEGVKRTGIIEGTTNPVWNTKVSFGSRTILDSSVGWDMPTLRVKVGGGVC